MNGIFSQRSKLKDGDEVFIKAHVAGDFDGGMDARLVRVEFPLANGETFELTVNIDDLKQDA